MQAWRDPDCRLEFWRDVHGLDYSSMAELPLDEASVEVVYCKDTVTERCLCQDFNTETAKEKVTLAPGDGGLGIWCPRDELRSVCHDGWGGHDERGSRPS